MSKNRIDLTQLTPLVRTLTTLVGRRANEPELIAFVTEVLGQKVPASIGRTGQRKYVSAKKQGLELLFGHDVKNEQFPLIPKSKAAFVPYLELVWLQEKFVEPLPFGLAFGMAPDEITKLLGIAPSQIGLGTYGRTNWRVVLDAKRSVVLGVQPTEFTIGIEQAQELASRYHPPWPVVGLFLAWAVLRNLIDETRFPNHADLLAAMRRRERKGSDLITVALPRGLWSTHLKDLPELRHFAFDWFHNIGGSYVTFDLIDAFGGRMGPHGHQEPILDDDDWKAVAAATPALDKRFAQWVGKPTEPLGPTDRKAASRKR